MQPSPTSEPAASAGACPGAIRAPVIGIGRLIGTRSFRVITLVTMIAVMSVVDLYLTILYVTHTGMSEANPLARAMMGYQSPTILALWKLATVVLSLGILVVIRKKRSAEIGAWIECFVLAWLMVHWTGYIDLSAEMPDRLVEGDPRLDPNWIMMDAEAGLGNLIID